MKERICVLLLVSSAGVFCQQPAGPLPLQQTGPEKVPSNSSSSAPHLKEIISANDQLVVSAKGLEDIGPDPLRIEPDGSVTLPLVGKMRAEGLTVEQFQNELVEQLRAYLRSPQVSVKRLAARGYTIVTTGAFKTPGVYPLPARRNLLAVLTEVGGLQPTAGRRVKITRRADQGPIPLPWASEDPLTKVSVATINLNRIFENPDAAEDIVIQPHDILAAESAGVVYLTGQVAKGGSYPLVDRDSIGIAELISMAGGVNPDAALDRATILRPVLNGSKRAELPVDVLSILNGRSVDFPVTANDIVVIPRSKAVAGYVKKGLLFTAPAVLSGVLLIVLR